MNYAEKIIKCEHEYVKCFCETDEHEDIIRVKDNFRICITITIRG